MDPANSTSPQPGKNRRVIYVVDDEPMLLELASVILEPLGFKVHTFRDPEIALKTFQSTTSQPALVITDYAMHTMNGLELIAAFRKVNPRQKILLVSGTVDEQIYKNAPAKPDQFLAKPYQARELSTVVNSMLQV